MSWITTYTGRAFDLTEEKLDICIEDITHALSNICRFTGHTRRFYSVAEHSALMVQGLELDMGVSDPAVLKWALLHDASEAYLADIARPFKHFIGEKYREFDARINRELQDYFGVHPTDAQVSLVHEADVRMLISERDHLLAPSKKPWSEWTKDYLPFRFVTPEGLLPEDAKRLFESTYKYLFEDVAVEG